jgi:hypothetical protein
MHPDLCCCCNVWRRPCADRPSGKTKPRKRSNNVKRDERQALDARGGPSPGRCLGGSFWARDDSFTTAFALAYHSRIRSIAPTGRCDTRALSLIVVDVVVFFRGSTHSYRSIQQRDIDNNFPVTTKRVLSLPGQEMLQPFFATRSRTHHIGPIQNSRVSLCPQRHRDAR